ncbi:hypothetical protein Tco_0372120, partial [Tanacetum coccineum]
MVMVMVVCYDDGEDGGGGSGVVEVARGASGVVDRVDRSDGESFGLRRKNPPEKFSGGDVVMAGCRTWEGERR